MQGSFSPAWRALAILLALLLHASASADTGSLARTATELIGSLDASQREQLVHPLDSDLRATWSNLPTVMAPPAGVLLKALTDKQRKLAHELLRESLSSQGYGKAVGIMWLDDLLYELEEAALRASEEPPNPVRLTVLENRSSGHYALAVFGDPGASRWGWKLTGHRLAINVTVHENSLSVLPGFYGSSPRVVEAGPYAGYSALGAERELGLALLGSLDKAQRTSAVISGEKPGDVIEGPGRRGSLEEYEGLQAGRLSSAQLELLQLLVGEYLRNASASSAADQLDAIAAAGWRNVWFSWRGPTDGMGEFYYRVHGPRILIEYNLVNDNHDHSVVRDPLNDYGEDWLGYHYKESHPTMDEARATLRRAAGVDE